MTHRTSFILILALAHTPLTLGAAPRLTPTDPPSTGTSSTTVSPQEKPLTVYDVHGASLGSPIGQFPSAYGGTGHFLSSQNPGVVARRVSGAVVGLNIARQGFVHSQIVGEYHPNWLTPQFVHENVACTGPRYLIMTDAPIRMAQVLGKDLTVEFPGGARLGYYPGNPVGIHHIVATEFAYDPDVADCTVLGGTPSVPGFCCYPLVGSFDAEAGPAISFDLESFDPPFEVK